MVTFLIILMMVCNLWVLFYLTWEHRETRKADRHDGTEQARQEPLPDIMGKSKFRMPERTRTEKDTTVPEAATSAKAEPVDEKDVTFADELKGIGSPAEEKDVSRQVPDEDLDEESSDSVSAVTSFEENPLVEAYNIYCAEAKQNPDEEILKFDEFVQQMTLASIQLTSDESTKLHTDSDVSIMQPYVDTRPVDLSKPPVPEEEPDPAKVEVMDLTKEESVSPGIGNRMMAEALEKAIQESPESNSAKMVVPVRRKNE